MGATTKGFPYPDAGDANNVPADIEALADAVDATPGIASLSTAARDALGAAAKWAGRVIWNATTGRLQAYDGSSWYDVAPAGTVTAYAGSSAPGGWLLCDGSNVSRATYAQLFALIGTTDGAGDGSTTFGLPNLKGRVPVGLDAGQTEFDALGEAGGSKTSTAPHTHAIDHDHGSFTSAANSGTAYDGAQGTHAGFYNTYSAQPGFTAVDGWTVQSHTHSIDVPALTQSSGASSAAATSGNLQPYLTLHYIIKT